MTYTPACRHSIFFPTYLFLAREMDFSPREVAFHLLQFSDEITGHSEPLVHLFVTVTKLISRGRNKYVQLKSTIVIGSNHF